VLCTGRETERGGRHGGQGAADSARPRSLPARVYRLTGGGGPEEVHTDGAIFGQPTPAVPRIGEEALPNIPVAVRVDLHKSSVTVPGSAPGADKVPDRNPREWFILRFDASESRLEGRAKGRGLAERSETLHQCCHQRRARGRMTEQGGRPV
jgi:hypothetical protein